jgi:hypothetical protein
VATDAADRQHRDPLRPERANSECALPRAPRDLVAVFVDPGRVCAPAALQGQIRPPRRTHQAAPLVPLAPRATLAPHVPRVPRIPLVLRAALIAPTRLIRPNQTSRLRPQKPVALPHYASDPGPPDACPTVAAGRGTGYPADGARWTPLPIQGYGLDREDRDRDQAENSFRSWRRFNVRKQIIGGLKLWHTTIQWL